MLAIHGVAICFYLGPSRTASLTFKVALATAGYKFCEVLVNSAPGEVRRAGRPAGSRGLQCAQQGGHPSNTDDARARSSLPAAPTAGVARRPAPPPREQAEQKDLSSVWDWQPPGDLGGSGAWTVVRELALTLSRWPPRHRSMHVCRAGLSATCPGQGVEARPAGLL